ncbi:MAG: DUF58 domain-containing protein [Acidobacteriota bacterium]|nr:MAG: DUF58 domain-containing protein [Acidobacteriota bacterium]
MTDTRGVYVTLDGLVRLQYRARGFDFLPRQPVHSLLTGRHASRLRGRGLNFEEIRAYLPGDDVRAIDWKVTARKRETHIRVYTEERDRPAFLVVDQRISMFFGTRVNMKSVTAAELAAAAAWRVFGQGDRVGAVVFDDTASTEVRPHRSQETVYRILQAVVDKNSALRADSDAHREPAMLNRVLESVGRFAAHDYLVAIISDFDGANEATRRLVSRLAQHNDVLAVPIYDPIATEVPEAARLVVSDGELQVEVDTGRGAIRERLTQFSDERLGAIIAWQTELGVPVLPITTDKDALEQIRRLLGVR